MDPRFWVTDYAANWWVITDFTELIHLHACHKSVITLRKGHSLLCSTVRMTSVKKVSPMQHRKRRPWIVFFPLKMTPVLWVISFVSGISREALEDISIYLGVAVEFLCWIRFCKVPPEWCTFSKYLLKAYYVPGTVRAFWGRHWSGTGCLG